MGWDQTSSRESVTEFLLSLLGIDEKALIAKAIEEKLKEQDVSYTVEGDDTRNLDTPNSVPRVIRFSDGRVFVETLTEVATGDAWGSEHYTFVAAGEPYSRITKKYDGDELDVYEEVFPGHEPVPSTVSEVFENSDLQDSAVGQEIVDFLDRHGIKEVSLDPENE